MLCLQRHSGIVTRNCNCFGLLFSVATYDATEEVYKGRCSKHLSFVINSYITSLFSKRNYPIINTYKSFLWLSCTCSHMSFVKTIKPLVIECYRQISQCNALSHTWHHGSFEHNSFQTIFNTLSDRNNWYCSETTLFMTAYLKSK